MVKPKKGDVLINTGFEAIYKSKLYHAIVRVVKVEGNDLWVRSLCDTLHGEFAFGGYLGQPFKLDLKKEFESGHFRYYKSGDIQKIIKQRKINRILYGQV
jgi:hypothetical protein